MIFRWSFCWTLAVLLAIASADTSPPAHARRAVSTSFGVVRGETITPGPRPAGGHPIPRDSVRPRPERSVSVWNGGVSLMECGHLMSSAAKWTHQPKDAFRNPPVCIQSGFNHQSETEALKVTSAQRFDFIHRVTPFPQTSIRRLLVLEPLHRNNATPLSVLVLVHGSEFGWGSGNSFNGSVLAAHGQIVVVTVNYRLDIYGFLGRCEANSCTGNAGMSDLVAALKMLSNILPAFGADAQSITLMGWGSGASLVSLLMASPITQPKGRLFKRAILLDGTALSPWAITDNPQQYFMRICIDVKKAKDPVARQELFNKHIAQLTRCLQEQSQLNVTTAARKIKAPSFMSAFAPIVDGQIVPNHPKFSFSPKFGALFREIDLLVGSVSHPAHFLLPNADLNEGITTEKRDRILRTLVRNLFDYHRGEIFNGILNEYTDWEAPRQNDSKTIRDSVLNALDDALYVSPLIETLRAHSTDEAPKSSSTYFFVFAHETRAWSAEQPGSGIQGAFSDDHVAYILGYPLISNSEESLFTSLQRVRCGHFESDHALREQLRQVGPMSTETTVEDRFHGVAWPEYNAATRESYLEITDKPQVRNFYRNAQVGFWSQFVPQLNRGNKERNVEEEHHFLPDHFNRQTFYGIPKDIKKPSTTAIPPTAEKSADDAAAKTTELADVSYTYLGYFGVFCLVLLVLNACFCIAIARKYIDNKQGSKKPVHYQSYLEPRAHRRSQLQHRKSAAQPAVRTSGNGGTAPPSRHHSRDETSRTSSFAFETSLNSLKHQHLPQYHQLGGFPSAASSVTSPTTPHAPLLNGGFNAQLGEQEPLLAASSKGSTPAMIRTSGISPTCPRHGRAAQLMQNSRANSIGSTARHQPLEQQQFGHV
ncbi:Neuroligin variant [Aphelenchoides fujianensis]|nr:Neuroligin variant [Aphelenchoides fujianensis]